MEPATIVTAWRRISRKWRGRALEAFAIAWGVVLIAPWLPVEVPWELDWAWGQLLHDAFLRGAGFGRDVVFTYGPWGFLSTGFHPATWPVVAVVGSLLAITYLWAVATTSRRFGSRVASSLVVILCAAAVAVTGYEVLLLSMPLAAFFIVRERERPEASSAAWVVLAALALTSLIKFSAFLMAVIVVFILAAEQIGRRRAPSTLLMFLLPLGGWWLLAGQELPGFLPYVSSSLQMAAEYADAMSIGPDGHEHYLLAFASITSAMAITLLLQKKFEPGALIVFAAFSAIIMKAGYVRWDLRHLIVAHGALAAGILLFAAHTRLRSRNEAAVVLSALAVAGSLLTAADLSGSAFPFRALDTVAATVNIERAASRARYEELRSLLERRIEDSQWLPEGMSVGQRGDVYGTFRPFLYGHPSYTPRPTLQYYAGYTAKLAAIDAARLRSDSAPETLIFGFQPFDDRYPSLQDSRSWIEIIDRYDLAVAQEDRLVLSRSRSRRCAPEDRPSTTAGIAEVIEIPFEGPVWARIVYGPTAPGRFASTLFRIRPMRLEVQTPEGWKDYRLIRSLAADGFLLSPLVEDGEEMQRLLQNRPPISRVRRFRLVDPYAGSTFSFYRPVFSVELMPIVCGDRRAY